MGTYDEAIDRLYPQTAATPAAAPSGAQATTDGSDFVPVREPVVGTDEQDAEWQQHIADRRPNFAGNSDSFDRQLAQATRDVPRAGPAPVMQEGGLLAAKPQASGSASEYDDAIDKLFPDTNGPAARRAADFLAWKAQNAGVDSARAVDVLRVAEASGLAPSFVASNLDELRKQYDPGTADLRAVAAQSPGMREFLAQSDIHPAAVKDDARRVGGVIGSIEDFGHAITQAPAALWDATLEMGQTYRESKDLLGFGSPENDKAMSDFEAAHPAEQDYGVHGYLGNALLGGVKMIPLIVADQAAGMLVGGLSKLAAVGEVVAGGGPEDPAADVAAAGTVVAGEALSHKIGSFGVNFLAIAAPAYRKFKAMRGANGEPMPEGLARTAAIAAGLAGGGLAAVAGGPAGTQVSKLTSKLPFVKDLVDRYSVEAVSKLLADKNFAAAAERLTARYGAGVVNGALLMAAQSATTQASEEAAKGAAGNGFEAHALNIATASADGFVKGVQDMLFVHGALEAHGDLQLMRHAATMRDVLKDVDRSAQSTTSAVTLRSLVENAATSKSPPELVEQAALAAKNQPGAPQSVYVAREGWTRLAQEEKADPRELAVQALGDDGAAYDQADATGGELVVPAEKFARLAREKPDFARSLLEDARSDQDHFTPRQMRERNDALQSRIGEVSKQAPGEMEDDTRRVYEDWRARFEAAGRSSLEADSHAKVAAGFFDAMARRFAEEGNPKSAWDIHQGYATAVYGPNGHGLPPLEADTSFGEAHPDHLELPVGEGVEVPSGVIPTEGDMGRARAYADNLRGDRKAAAHEFLDYREADQRRRDEQITQEKRAAKVRREMRGLAKKSKLGQPLVASEHDESSGGAPAEPQGHLPVLKRLWDGLTTEEKISRYHTDYNGTGLLNFRGYEAKPRDPARPRTAELGIEGFKPVNDNFGHDAGDSLVNVLARATRDGGITDAVRTGNTVKFDVATAEETAKIAELAEKLLGHGVKVTFGTSEPMPDATAEDRLQAAADAHNASKDARQKAGEVGGRKDWAKAFVAADKQLPFHKRLFGREERVKERAKAFVEKHAEAAPVDRAQLGPEHEKSYAQKLQEKGEQHGFDEVHLTPEGLLSLDGYYEAEKAVIAEAKDRYKGDWEKHVHYVAADARGIKDTDKAFGAGLDKKVKGKPTDEIMSAVAKVLHAGGAAEFNVARPHGDEFYAVYLGDEEQADRARDFFDEADEKTSLELFARKVGDGFIVQEGVRIAHGHGPDFDTADRTDLPRAKANQRDLPKPRTVSARQYERVVERWSRRVEGRGAEDYQPGRNRPEPRRVGEGLRPENPGGDGAQGGGAGGREGEGRPEVVPIQLTRLFQPDEPGDFRLNSSKGRGYIEFSPPGGQGRRSFDIHLLKNADASTVIHELGHFFSEVMADLAQQDDAPASIKQDYAELLKWQEYESHEQRVAEGKERLELAKKVEAGTATAEDKARLKKLEAKEERFSHGFEQFAAEGKAPSVALARAFERFRRWMVGIYKGIAGIQDTYRKNYGEEIGLNDQVREIFSRMVAADDEVERQRAAQQAGQIPGLADGATPEERDEYERISVKVAEDAKSEMVRRISEAQRKENNAFFRRERARLQDQVEKELDQTPAYRALSYLHDGKLPGVDELPPMLTGADGKPLKLDRKAVEARFGKEFAQSMPRGIFAEKDAPSAAPDDLAPLLGFASGEDLVRALQAAEPRSKRIAREVQERLEAKYGPALLDAPQALAEEAMDALHNDAAVKKLLLERRMMARKLNPARAGHALDLDPEMLKTTAERLVREQTVGKITGGEEGIAGYYLRAERTAAKRALKAMEAGKVDEALGHNEAQLLNAFLYRAAKDARARLETDTDLLHRSTETPWLQALGKADVAARTDAGDASADAYLPTHTAILQAVGLADGKPDYGVLDKLVGLVGSEALPFDVPGLRRLLVEPKAWGELTTGEAQNVMDAVRSLKHAAMKQTEYDIAGKRIDRAELFRNLTESAAKGAQLGPEANTSSGRTASEKASGYLRGLDAYLTEVHQYIDQLEPDRNGPLHQVAVDEYRERRDFMVTLDKGIVEKVRKLIEDLPKKLRNRMNERVDGLGDLLPMRAEWQKTIRPPETRSDLWTLLLQWGNADNRQRIRDGNGWSDGQVEKALQLLTVDEARFLQGLLDVTDSLWPELAKVHKQRTGLELGKVDPTAISVGGESFKGGYFPLRYDPRISQQGLVQLSSVEKELFPTGQKPTVYSGHTKARMEKVLAPVSLEFGTLPSHLSGVTLDIALGDWVRKVGSIVMDQRFKDAAATRIGRERLALFMPWLRDIATQRAGSTAAAAEGTPGAITAFRAMAKNRAALAVMGANLPSMLAHLTDPLVAIGTAKGPVEMAKLAARLPIAYAKVIGGAGEGLFRERPEYALSKELRYRSAREQENIRKEFSELRKGPTTAVGRALEPAGKVLDAVNEVASRARFYMDDFHSRVLWQLGYDQAVSEGVAPEEAARRGDDLLQKTLPSGDIADRAAILRSKSSIGAVTMFYGYASKMFNLWVHAPLARARDAWVAPDATAWTRASSAADLAAKWIVMGAIGALGAKLAGRGPKDDDEEKHDTPWLARRALLEPFNTVPVLGPALESIVEGKPVSVRTAPEAQFVADAAGKFHKLVKKAVDGEGGDADVWSALDLLTGALGVAGGPAGQVQRTAGYIRAVSRGEQAAPEGPLDAVRGGVYGPEKGERR